MVAPVDEAGAATAARPKPAVADPPATMGRLNRLYVALRLINQAIVRLETRDELFQRVCAILVLQGGFRIAWIGWPEEGTRRLVPVAQAGDDGGYLLRAQAYDEDRPEGRGPSGRAFREGRPYVCNDLRADVATAPWHADLERSRVRASVALPIRRRGEVCGTLSVYAGRRGYFQDKELALLMEAAVDLSFALDNLARQDERRRTEEIANRFASIVESTDDAIIGRSLSGVITSWNSAARSMFGYDAGEALGRSVDFLIPSDRADEELRIAQRLTRGERIKDFETRRQRKDGTVFPVSITFSPIWGPDPTTPEIARIVGISKIVRDISERKRNEDALAKSEARYRTTLDNIIEGCQIIGLDWRYLYLNQAAALHNRRPNAELLGNRMQDAWPGIDTTGLFELLRTCMEQRIVTHEEVEFSFADGTSGWFDVRVEPVPEGIFVLSVEISKRRLAEQALQALNESLERKVAERTRELEIARSLAEAADRLKSSFLATMSHELRTPLNSIIGFTGILVGGLAGPLNPEQTKQLGMVQGSARHLLALINDVLDISKIEAGQLELHVAPFDVVASLERVRGSVAPQADKKHLTVQIVTSPDVGAMRSDRRRVEQIVLNLLSNAIKFTDRGGVTLAVQAFELAASGGGRTRPGVRIQVTDTGIGIAPSDLARLFQPFQQLDVGLQRQHEGTGLGLAICRRLTSLLGGTIGADSTPQGGSCFTVHLPLELTP